MSLFHEMCITYVSICIQNNPSDIGPETKFRLSLRQDGVTLESFVMDGQHVAVTAEGEMKSAAGATKDFDAQFTVKLIVSKSSWKTLLMFMRVVL